MMLKWKALIGFALITGVDAFSSAKELNGRRETLFTVAYDTIKEMTIETSSSDSLYTVTVIEEGRIREKTVLCPDYNPIKIVEYESNGKRIHTIDFNYSTRKVYISGNYSRTVNLTDNLLPNNTSLFYIFEKILVKEDMVFTLLDYRNDRFVLMNMKYVGTDSIEIENSKIISHKYEMGLRGFFASRFWPYKYYYWYCSEKHEFKMYEGPDADKQIENVRTGR